MKREKKRKPLDPVTAETVLVLCGVVLANVLIADSIERAYPATYVGEAGLLAARHQLVRYLISRVVRILLPFGMVLFTGFLVHLSRRESLKPSRERLFVAGVLVLFFYPVTFQNRTGLEMQFELNGYHGIRPMKAIALLIDINKDLSEKALPKQTYYLKIIREDCGYTIHSARGRHSSHRKILEFMLQEDKTQQPIAQIAYGDYLAAKQLCNFTEHRLALYPHSGLIASFDGGDMTGINDIETLFTLTRNGNIVTRSVHPREEEMLHLTMIVQRDGEIIGKICADKPREEWMSLGLNTEVWLEMSYEGKTVRVSNILSF